MVYTTDLKSVALIQLKGSSPFPGTMNQFTTESGVPVHGGCVGKESLRFAAEGSTMLTIDQHSADSKFRASECPSPAP